MITFRKRTVTATVLSLFFFGLPARSQEPAGQVTSSPSGYLLGPDDQIRIHLLDGLDLGNTPILIGSNGNITLPLLGRVKAAGRTVEELESDLTTLFKAYIQEPQVTVTVAEFGSQPVSVFGAVTTPGVVQLRGRKTLSEILSMAGGPRDTAGSTISITRLRENGFLPVPGATWDPTGRFSRAELDLGELLEGKNPAANIEIKPHDAISVSQGNSKMIYVVGDVGRAGAFSLGSQKTMSVLSALSLAGGTGRTAKPESAKIFRVVPGEPVQHVVIAVNIKQILGGKTEDIGLRPEDVLVVPTSSRKNFTNYVVPVTIAAAVSAAIYAGAH